MTLNSFTRIKNYSEDTFELKSRLTSREIVDRLQEHTLRKKWLSMSWTTRDFIGHIDPESFAVISSSFPFPYGAACILRGKIGPTSEITLTTTLHQAFRILFLVWLIFMTIGFIGTWWSETGGLIGAFVILLCLTTAGLILRLYLHGMYVWARRDAVKRLRQILEPNNLDTLANTFPLDNHAVRFSEKSINSTPLTKAIVNGRGRV